MKYHIEFYDAAEPAHIEAESMWVDPQSNALLFFVAGMCVGAFRDWRACQAETGAEQAVVERPAPVVLTQEWED